MPVLVITRGEEGATIALRGGSPEEPGGARTIRIPAARLRSEALDPTGVGDAFRSGLVASRLRGLPWEEAGRVGAVAAVLCLETLGPQAKRWTPRRAPGAVRRRATADRSPARSPSGFAVPPSAPAGVGSTRPAGRFSLLD